MKWHFGHLLYLIAAIIFIIAIFLGVGYWTTSADDHTDDDRANVRKANSLFLLAIALTLLAIGYSAHVHGMMY